MHNYLSDSIIFSKIISLFYTMSYSNYMGYGLFPFTDTDSDSEPNSNPILVVGS